MGGGLSPAEAPVMNGSSDPARSPRFRLHKVRVESWSRKTLTVIWSDPAGVYHFLLGVPVNEVVRKLCESDPGADRDQVQRRLRRALGGRP